MKGEPICIPREDPRIQDRDARATLLRVTSARPLSSCRRPYPLWPGMPHSALSQPAWANLKAVGLAPMGGCNNLCSDSFCLS